MHKKIGHALVVGAGISGIRSALDLAQNGYGVTLIERAPHIGGILSQLDRQFPTNRCGMCKMLPVLERDSGSQFCLRKGIFHENIRLQTATQLTSVTGEPGHLKVRLRHAPTFVDGKRCVGCGACAVVCPVEVPDRFNAGLSMRKAIYRPSPHAVFSPFVIDTAACTRCGECQTICPTEAVDLSQEARRRFHILVVDDELVVRDSLKEWLVDEGFSVTMAESGVQALEKLEEARFHLMLTDIKMPGMDGVELLEQAQSRHPELTVVMMTAYATVETAVDAMKIGALDYLMKPFDPEKLMPLVNGIYAEMVASQDEALEVGVVVLAGGVDYFNPGQEKNLFGYGTISCVVTQLEFERLLSGCGPTSGHLVRPGDGKPIEKIAFLQCVGSRDLQHGADFCSTACCMISVKQAVLAKEIGGSHIDTTIFYMDMRANGLGFQRICDQAQQAHQVRFERGRVHSLSVAAIADDPMLRHLAMDGTVREERFDLVVLAAGQRPANGTPSLAQMAGLTLNPWGFIRTHPLSAVLTDHPGIVTAGSCTGLKDVGDSVLQASAAAAEASRILHGAGGSLGVQAEPHDEVKDVSLETPHVLVIVCTCDEGLGSRTDIQEMKTALLNDPSVAQVIFLERLCGSDAWDRLKQTAFENQPNRVLLAACHPYAFIPGLKALAEQMGLTPNLIEAVDLRIHDHPPQDRSAGHAFWMRLSTALVRLRHVNPRAVEPFAVVQSALVMGGGIAGMQAALTIAEQGYPVTLVEKEAHLGGNLLWLNTTIEGQDLKQLLAQTVERVDKHPRIEVLLHTVFKGAYGQVGRFYTTVETNHDSPRTLEHGVVLLATGGGQAPTRSLGFGSHRGIITQKDFEVGLADGSIEIKKLTTVSIILCVDSRTEPRNYCSRVCCPTALKHALDIKKKNQDTEIYVFYRDMMTCGFLETFFTQARGAGVIFTPYTPDCPPTVRVSEENGVQILARDPVLSRSLEIQSDLVVLATGIIPHLPVDLATAYGAQVDDDGFFKPADVKWRPVDSLAQGVFACGLAHSPRTVTEAMTTAQAAAQRALHVLARPTIAADQVVARVRHSLCSLCQRCIEVCPFAARTLNPEGDRIVVNPVMCQGCGACSAACPNNAAIVEGFTGGQVLETIDIAAIG